MRNAKTIAISAVDAFLSPKGKFLHRFADFAVALDEAGIPAPWLSRHSRLSLDAPRRSVGHSHPFIAEDGCGVYLPEDYFHLRPAKTVRLGRFTCIPIAEPHPNAAEALDALAEETSVPVVPLRSLSPRELVQNSGLPLREAELLRQRDFDELFFFAGASDADIQRFADAARTRQLHLRQDGVLWSLAVGASLAKCVQELSRLYDRARREHMVTVGLATEAFAAELLPLCDRAILLTSRVAETSGAPVPGGGRTQSLPLHGDEAWQAVLATLMSFR